MVARKSSAQVATPQSTPTTQRTRKAKSTSSEALSSATGGATSQGHVNGHSNSASPKKGAAAKSKSKSKSKTSIKAPRTQSFVSRFVKYLTELLLIAITLYTITVCPDDTYLENPLCRTLTTYDRAIWKPYVEPRINALLSRPEVAPHVAQIQRVSQPYVKYAQLEWKRNVTPRLRHLAHQADPLIHRADVEYKKHLEPTVLYAKYHLSHYYRAAEPHVHHFARLAQEYWLQVLPHLKPLWDRKKNVTEWTQKHVMEPLGALKAEYVDSQVEKMLHKVEEVGEGRTRAATTPQTVTSSARVSTTFASAASVPDSGPDTVTEHEPEPEQTADHTQKPIIPPGPIIPPVPPSPQEPDSPPNARSTDFENDDAALDEFLRDLEDPPAVAEPEPQPEEQVPEGSAEEPVWEETEEERQRRIEERAAETAKQRASIMTRLEAWEKKEVAEGKRQLGVLKEGLANLRAEWIQELRSDTGELRAELAKLSTESERVIKGAEAYAKKLMGGKTGGAEKVALFDNIIAKASKKFKEQGNGFEGKIQAWLDRLREAELALSKKSFDAVDYISGDAQQDTGMDLSYLDDVTVADWTRYHDLMKTAKEYGRIYDSIVDGTHPDSVVSPLMPMLNLVKFEHQGIMREFDDLLAQAVKKAMQLFTGRRPKEPTTSSGAEKEEASILPVDDKEGLNAEAAQAILGRSKEEVEAAGARAETANVVNPPPVVGDKTTENEPTPAPQPEDLEAQAQKFAESIQAKLAKAIKDEEATLSKTIEEAKAKETPRPHEEL